MKVNAQNMKALSDATLFCMDHMFSHIKSAAEQGKSCIYFKFPCFTTEFINMIEYVLTHRGFKLEFHHFHEESCMYVYVMWE